MFSLTNLFGKAMMYLVIALWKLEKPIVRKAPSGAFRYLYEQNIKSSLSYHFCKEYGDLQSDYLNVKNYDYTGKKKNVINKMVKIMSGQLRYDSDYAYIRHYMNTYQYVPLWVLMNVLTIGQLSKIYASQKGRIQIRVCQDFGTLKVNELGKMLTVMTKFNGDIFSNITISAPQLGLKEAWEAAEMAGVADDIRNMPMGMHTILSEGSGGISGGQRQRLMIARAIVTKPKVLLFDEATSALDNITQKHVSDSLKNLKSTRIVIAHRLSTIKECDRIIVLDKGHIIEDGTYQSLSKAGGFFSELVERQKN